MRPLISVSSRSFISCSDDFFAASGVDSYYDFKAAKINIGDIVLDADNVQALHVPDVDVKRALYFLYLLEINLIYLWMA